LNTQSILRELDAEIARLQEVRQVLADTFVRRGPGRPSNGGSPARKKTHRKISAEGRARIAAAQKKRWAAAKKAKQ